MVLGTYKRCKQVWYTLSQMHFKNITGHRGFTLVEILIVISIIGFLAAFVLVSINRARQKAYDAKTQVDLKQVRTLGEIYYTNNNNSYDSFDTCVTSPSAASCTTQNLADDIQTLTDDLFTIVDSGDLAHEADSDGFCFSAPLRTTISSYACVDALNSVIVTTNACGGSTFKCN